MKKKISNPFSEGSLLETSVSEVKLKEFFSNDLEASSGGNLETDQSKRLNSTISAIAENIERCDFSNLIQAPILAAIQSCSENGGSATELFELQKKLEGVKLKDSDYIGFSIKALTKSANSLGFAFGTIRGDLYVYNGCSWQKCEDDHIQVLLRIVAIKTGVPLRTRFKVVFAEGHYKRIFQEYVMSVPPKSETVINLRNGTLEISSKGAVLREFSPDDFLMYQLDFDYNPNAKAPKFDKFLERVLPEIESQEILSEYSGYVFTKNGHAIGKHEKVLFLFGDGANGKSVFFDVITSLLGRANTTNYSLESLTLDKNHCRAGIERKLLNYASDISGVLDVANFKVLAAGEPIEAKTVYKPPFIMTDYAKLMFNNNSLPSKVEHTHAFFRRFLIVHFNQTIPKEEQDRSLSNDIVSNELSGVLNWVLSGLSRLVKNGDFTNSVNSEKVLDLFKNDSDTVKTYLNEYGLTPIEGDVTSLRTLYTSYCSYCQDYRLPRCNKSIFSKRLVDAGFQKVKRNYGTCFKCNAPDII